MVVVDPDQRTAEETVTDAGGKVQKKTTYLLDERNFAMSAIHYDAKGNIRYREAFQRDTADRVVESTFTSGDGKRLGRRVFLFQGNKAIGWDDYDAADNRIAAGRPGQGPGRPDKHKH